MWLSASAFFYKYFRVYSPVAFGKKTDKTGEYIRKYVPELKNYPAGAIYEPWKVSAAEQAKYKCVLGKDYPHRIVVHEEVMKENMAKMNQAYAKNRERKAKLAKEGVKNDDEEEASTSSGKRKASKTPPKKATKKRR